MIPIVDTHKKTQLEPMCWRNKMKNIKTIFQKTKSKMQSSDIYIQIEDKIDKFKTIV